MFIVLKKKVFLGIGLALVALSVVFLVTWGLKLGIDFTGGAITEVKYQERPEPSTVREKLSTLNLGDYSIQSVDEDGLIIRTRFLQEEERKAMAALLEEEGGSVERHSSIGPSVSKELADKSLYGIGLVILLTIIFIAFTFRSVKETEEDVSSWNYGFVAIATLLHDILIPIGVFALLGRFFNVEVDILFVMAMLSILGLSINDTIVIFDRIRENIKFNREKRIREEFAVTVGKSLSETFTRSFNTSVSTLLVLLALLFLGGASTKLFILAMTVGMVAGVYSSLFIAAPLLVLLSERQQKK